MNIGQQDSFLSLGQPTKDSSPFVPQALGYYHAIAHCHSCTPLLAVIPQARPIVAVSHLAATPFVVRMPARQAYCPQRQDSPAQQCTANSSPGGTGLLQTTKPEAGPLHTLTAAGLPRTSRNAAKQAAASRMSPQFKRHVRNSLSANSRHGSISRHHNCHLRCRTVPCTLLLALWQALALGTVCVASCSSTLGSWKGPCHSRLDEGIHLRHTNTQLGHTNTHNHCRGVKPTCGAWQLTIVVVGG
jgi:hypothetical protein